jgi:16S rRNA (cytidine1402-2'-O)-methyltransferase
VAGILYIVATPIGNLEDFTFRALRVLKEADLIAAEDTRHSRKLLDHYGVKTPLTSYHEHNERSKAQHLITRLQRGENIALISDAGTPALSDPGQRLVQECIRADITVSPVPGPSSLLAALTTSGLPMDRFVFEGFLPAKTGERREKLHALRSQTRTVVIYEAPHRLMQTLEDIREALGERQIVIAREMTKMHEEFARGTAAALLERFREREVRGELTIVISGATDAVPPERDLVISEIRRLQNQGMKVKEIASSLGEKYRLPKREVYRLTLDLEKSLADDD